jgi:hypothetical protein
MAAPLLITLALLQAAQAVVINGGSGFCERMAAQTGMKPVKEARATSFEVNKLGGIGTFLFGGSVTFMVSIEAEEGTDPAILAQNDCKTEPKVIVCNVVGPTTLKLTVNEQEFDFPAQAGDQARVSIINARKLRCDTL